IVCGAAELRASISVLFVYNFYDGLSLGIMRILVSTSKFPATRNKLQGSKSSSCDAPPPELQLLPPAQGRWPLPSVGRLRAALRCPPPKMLLLTNTTEA